MSAPTSTSCAPADKISEQRALGLAEKAGFAAIGRKADGSIFATLSGSMAVRLVRLVEAELKGMKS